MQRRFVIGAMVGLAVSWSAAAGDLSDGLRAFDAGDYAAAFSVWRPLAEAGDPDAQAAMAGLYTQGLGVRQDMSAAARWYRRAARQGHVGAQINLGELYARGRGVPRDLVRAYAWLDLAARAGNAWATEHRDKLAERMTLEELAMARRLAEQGPSALEGGR